VPGFVDRGWDFRGYHQWNAYCGQAAGPSVAGPAPTGAPTRTATVRPARTSAVNGRPHLPQPPTLASYQEDLHRVHDLADHLNRLRPDGAIHAHRHTLPPELAYELADAIDPHRDPRLPPHRHTTPDQLTRQEELPPPGPRVLLDRTGGAPPARPDAAGAVRAPLDHIG